MSEERRQRQAERLAEETSNSKWGAWRFFVEHAAPFTFVQLLTAAAVVIGTGDYDIGMVLLLGASFSGIVWWLNAPEVKRWERSADRPIGWVGIIGIVALSFVVIYWVYRKKMDYELHQLKSALIPGDQVDPYKTCPYSGDEVAIYVSDEVIVTNNFPLSILALDKHPVLSVNRGAKGEIKISAEIFDRNGDIVYKNHR